MISKISKIDLFAVENDLLEQISFTDHNHEVLRRSIQAAGKLTEILINRQAIPKIRIEYFTNSKYNVGNNKSRMEIFENNGTKGTAIFYHGNFLKYLRYFIFGPDLPSSLIDEFCKEIDEDDLPATSRRLVRKYELNSKVSEEFYKLCLECNLTDWQCSSVRDSVRRVK